MHHDEAGIVAMAAFWQPLLASRKPPAITAVPISVTSHIELELEDLQFWALVSRNGRSLAFFQIKYS